MGFECIEGCGQCCLIVPWPKDEYEHLKVFACQTVEKLLTDDRLVYPITRDGRCVFLSPLMRCAVYDRRPLVCRQYGRIANLPCPRVDFDGRRRPRAEMRRVAKAVGRQVDKRIEHWKRTMTIGHHA